MNVDDKLSFLSSFGMFLKSEQNQKASRKCTVHENVKQIRKWNNLTEHYFRVGDEFPYDIGMRPSEYKLDDICPLCDTDCLSISLTTLVNHNCRADLLSVALPKVNFEESQMHRRKLTKKVSLEMQARSIEPIIRLQKNSVTLARLLGGTHGPETVNQLLLSSAVVAPSSFDASKYTSKIDELEVFVKKGGMNLIRQQYAEEKARNRINRRRYKKVKRKPSLQLHRFDSATFTLPNKETEAEPAASSSVSDTPVKSKLSHSNSSHRTSEFGTAQSNSAISSLDISEQSSEMSSIIEDTKNETVSDLLQFHDDSVDTSIEVVDDLQVISVVHNNSTATSTQMATSHEVNEEFSSSVRQGHNSSVRQGHNSEANFSRSPTKSNVCHTPKKSDPTVDRVINTCNWNAVFAAVDQKSSARSKTDRTSKSQLNLSSNYKLTDQTIEDEVDDTKTLQEIKAEAKVNAEWVQFIFDPKKATARVDDPNDDLILGSASNDIECVLRTTTEIGSSSSETVNDCLPSFRSSTPTRHSECSDKSVENMTPPSEPETGSHTSSESPSVQLYLVRKRLGRKIQEEMVERKRRKNHTPSRKEENALSMKQSVNVFESQSKHEPFEAPLRESTVCDRQESDEADSISTVTSDSGIQTDAFNLASIVNDSECTGLQGKATKQVISTHTYVPREKSVNRPGKKELNNNDRWRRPANVAVIDLTSDDELLTTGST